ncbi:MAG: helix-turn-helix domain-containing protein [Defluviitaleaceae bacterium]|nr:helix-turn-helix domain-containing protein [Defluviitaleaceae bacterium]
MGLEISSLELEILNKLPKSIANTKVELQKISVLENKINKYFRDLGESTPRLLDILRIFEIYRKNYERVDLKNLYLIADPIIQRLNYLNFKKWDNYDIRIAGLVVSYTATFEEANEFANNAFEAIKLHKDKEAVNKSNYNIHSNILIRFLQSKFFDVDDIENKERYKNLERLFKHHSQEALKICDIEGEKSYKYKLMILIRIALWNKNSDEVTKNLALIKDTKDRQLHKTMREEVAICSDHPDFELNEEQNSIFIGDNITKRREKLGISIGEFMDLLDYTDSYVYGIERGEINIPTSTLIKISKILSISLDELCLGKNRKNIKKVV